MACYDAQKTPVTRVYPANADKYFEVPSGIYFVRFPVRTANVNITVITKLDSSDTLPFSADNEPYIPYGGLTLPYMQLEIEGKATAADVPGKQWQGKVWYAYGTSITNIANEGKYPTYVAAMSGMSLVNKGISGGGIGDLGGYSHGQVYDAICNITDGKLDADLITLETGANDINSAGDIPLGTIYDTGRTTLSGCLNDCLRYLQANTDAQIVVMCSPISKAQRITEEHHQYYTWADMIEQICRLNRVHFINSDNNMGYAKLTDESKGPLYVVDNIHQTNLGGYIMAENIWYQLRNIPCFYTSLPSN